MPPNSGVLGTHCSRSFVLIGSIAILYFSGWFYDADVDSIPFTLLYPYPSAPILPRLRLSYPLSYFFPIPPYPSIPPPLYSSTSNPTDSIPYPPLHAPPPYPSPPIPSPTPLTPRLSVLNLTPTPPIFCSSDRA